MGLSEGGEDGVVGLSEGGEGGVVGLSEGSEGGVVGLVLRRTKNGRDPYGVETQTEPDVLPSSPLQSH